MRRWLNDFDNEKKDMGISETHPRLRAAGIHHGFLLSSMLMKFVIDCVIKSVNWPRHGMLSDTGNSNNGTIYAAYNQKPTEYAASVNLVICNYYLYCSSTSMAVKSNKSHNSVSSGQASFPASKRKTKSLIGHHKLELLSKNWLAHCGLGRRSKLGYSYWCTVRHSGMSYCTPKKPEPYKRRISAHLICLIGAVRW